MAVGKKTCLAISFLAVALSAAASVQKADFVGLCEHGSVAEITAALKAGANINLGNSEGVTPLMCAAGYNSLAAVNLLIRAKADVKATDNEDWTALNFAVVYKHKDPECLEIVKALLAAGADVDAEADYENTPLMQAASLAENPEVIHVLLLAGADPNKTNLRGKTALALLEEENDALLLTDASDELQKAMKRGAIPQTKTVDPLPETTAPATATAPSPAAVNPGGALVGQWATGGEKDELRLVFKADGTYTSVYRTSSGVQNDQGNYQLTGDTLTLKMPQASVGAKLTWVNADTIGLVLEAGPQYQLFRVK
jgi:hypothetical protein